MMDFEQEYFRMKLMEEGYAHERATEQRLKELGICLGCKGDGVCWWCKGAGKEVVGVETPLAENPLQWFMDKAFDANRKEERGCNHCEGTGECYKCEGSGYTDPARRFRWSILVAGQVYPVSKKQVTEFRNWKCRKVQVGGVELRNSEDALVLAERDGLVTLISDYQSSKDKGYAKRNTKSITLHPSAVELGVVIQSFTHEVSNSDKVANFYGLLTASKKSISPEDLTSWVKVGDEPHFAGRLEFPRAAVGETVPFTVSFRPVQGRPDIQVVLATQTGKGDGKRYFIVARGKRYDPPFPKAKAFRDGEQVEIDGELLHASKGDLFGFDDPQNGVSQVLSIGNDQSVLLSQSAVAAGLVILKLTPKRDHMDAIVGVSGTLTITKRPLRSGDVEYRLIGVRPDRGELGTGTLDLPNTEVGEEVRFCIKDEDAFSTGKVVILIGVKAPEEGRDSSSEDEEDEAGALTVERWYYAKNKQRLGPFTTEQLRQLATAGAVQPTDMVLREGAQRWVQASSIGELAFPTSASLVPPPPPPPPVRWYYAREGRTLGPVTMEELRRLVTAGQLHPTDFVLQEGRQTWATVKSVPELSSSK